MDRYMLLISITAALASHSAAPSDLELAEKAARDVYADLEAKHGAEKAALVWFTAAPRVMSNPKINGASALTRTKDRDSIVGIEKVSGKVHPNELDLVLEWAAGVVGRLVPAAELGQVAGDKPSASSSPS